MSFQLFFRPKAEKDLSETEDYYNKISPDLTDRFFEEFFYTADFIQQNPYLYQVRYRGMRIAPFNNFPFGVHYTITGNKIRIYRVLHTKRYFK